GNRLLLADSDHDAGKTTELDNGADILTLGLHANGVLIGAGDHVDGAADQRLQRLRAAAEVIDGDVEALLLEIAEPFTDRQRQVIERGLAADRQRDGFPLDTLTLGGAGKRKHQHTRADRKLERAHRVLLPYCMAERAVIGRLRRNVMCAYPP